jgi:hypothetical protein
MGCVGVGTLLTAELALQHGLACSTAGGTHHAHSGFGSGFCIINGVHAQPARQTSHCSLLQCCRPRPTDRPSTLALDPL